MQELSGYIKLYRKFTDWGWYQDSVVKGLFLHCLLMASFKDYTFMGQHFKSGQFVTSLNSLSKDLGFSVQQIRTALKKLDSTGEITSKSTNKYTVITVVNWENYQTDRDYGNKENKKPPTNRQQHLKKVKNVKNSNTPLPQLFEILGYIREKSLNVDGEKFYKRYQENGWKTEKGESIKNWKRLLEIWSSKELADKPTYPDGYGGVKSLYDE